MKISQLITRLESFKENYGDCDVYGSAPYYEPEFELRNKNIHFFKKLEMNDGSFVENVVFIAP